MIRKSFALEAKSVDEAEGIVDAIVNVTGHVDRQKDMVHPGAFSKAVTGKMPKVVNSHQGSEFLGKVLSMREMFPGDSALPKSLTEKGLGGFAVKMQFNMETQSGREMFSNLKGGFVDEWSFMFSIADADYDAKGVRHIKLIDEIFEVSPVLVGASPGTLTLATKGSDVAVLERQVDRVAKAHEILDELRVVHGYFSKDAPLPPLAGDEAAHNEPFQHALGDIKELISQELGEDEPEADCVMELASIWQSLINWYEGEMNEYSSDASPMQAYSATPNIPALPELTARAIAAGVSTGRSRQR